MTLALRFEDRHVFKTHSSNLVLVNYIELRDMGDKKRKKTLQHGWLGFYWLPTFPSMQHPGITDVLLCITNVIHSSGYWKVHGAVVSGSYDAYFLLCTT